MLLVKNKITLSELQQLADARFGDMVKCVIDVEKQCMIVGTSLHADGEKSLIESGSLQTNLWGINIYVPYAGHESVEFDSMINIRPSAGNRSRSVENLEIQQKILTYIASIIKE